MAFADRFFCPVICFICGWKSSSNNLHLIILWFDNFWQSKFSWSIWVIIPYSYIISSGVLVPYTTPSSSFHLLCNLFVPRLVFLYRNQAIFCPGNVLHWVVHHYYRSRGRKAWPKWETAIPSPIWSFPSSRQTHLCVLFSTFVVFSSYLNPLISAASFVGGINILFCFFQTLHCFGFVSIRIRSIISSLLIVNWGLPKIFLQIGGP